ncbi:glycosyltransferase [Amphritea sp. 2_MG-2023]|uniref:glycosyltransferase family 4 protein n=1 Tax=Amphritea TaxID=515417 RepID=UPI001C07849B|nr:MULTISPECIES: glycosyltransferase [Amphritea]MBU2964353.1 glycosyltransferase [Amphritea atlantica]MDO6419687.1 glycosyltransferase [Amphritea sp. 2_MG-2023]
MNVKPTEYSYIIITDHGDINGGLAKVVVSQVEELATNQDKRVLILTGSSKLSVSLKNNENIDHVVIGKGEYLLRPNRIKGAIDGLFDFYVLKQLKRNLGKGVSLNTRILVHGWSKSLSPSIFWVLRKYGKITYCWNHDYFLHCPNGGYFDYNKKVSCREKPLSLSCIKRDCDSRSYYFKVWRVLRFFILKAVRGFFKEIAVTDASANVISEYSSDYKGRVIPNPIDIYKKPRIQAELNDYVVIVGRPSPEKGIDKLFETLKDVNYYRKVFIIGGLESDYEGVDSGHLSIEYCGWLDKTEVEKVMCKARYLIFPSLWHEAQGLVVTEAIAMGVPVICAEVNCGVEAVEKFKAGRLYDPYNSSTLVSALEHFELDANVEIYSENGYQSYWLKPEDIKNHITQVIKICR